jgi:hypothetical protein
VIIFLRKPRNIVNRKPSKLYTGLIIQCEAGGMTAIPQPILGKRLSPFWDFAQR